MGLHGQNQIQKMKNWINSGKALKETMLKLTDIQND